ncbi:hypothetical protein ACOME3_000750 [Neoechinorhynchus agilis]
MLKNKLEPLLGSLLDAHVTGLFPVEAYFSEAHTISQFTISNVFNSNTFQEEQVLLAPKSTVCKLFEEVSSVSKTCIDQILLVSNEILTSKMTQVLQSTTDLTSQFVLCSLSREQSYIVKPIIFEVHPMKRNNNVRDAYLWARETIGSMYHILKVADRMQIIPDSIKSTALTINLHIQTELNTSQKQLSLIKQQLYDIDSDIQSITSSIETDTLHGITLIDDLNELRSQYDEIYSHFSQCDLAVAKMEGFSKIKHSAILIADRNKSEILIKHLACMKARNYFRNERMKSLIDNGLILLDQFELETKQQHFNSEKTVAHMNRRIHLRSLRQKMVDIVMTELYPKLLSIHKEWEIWMW